MLNYLYWALCLFGAAVCCWYEVSKYTKLTLFSSMGLLSVGLALTLEALLMRTPDVVHWLLVFGIVSKLTDRILRKAVFEPRGWHKPMVYKGQRNV